MGHICHHAIVVIGTEWKFDGESSIEVARRTAIELGCDPVTEVASAPMNFYASFLIGPDGSKEGWDESDEGDDSRGEFVKWVAEHGDCRFQLVEVAFDESADAPRITRFDMGREPDED